MPRIVINRSYGGFSLSKKALSQLGITETDDIARDDPRLVQVVTELGKKANGRHADLAVVDAPEMWMIEEYDGNESVHIDWFAVARKIADTTGRSDLMPAQEDERWIIRASAGCS
jgi:hypothetical protein